MKAKYVSTVSRTRYIIIAVWIAAMSLAVLPAYYVSFVSGNILVTHLTKLTKFSKQAKQVGQYTVYCIL